MNKEAAEIKKITDILVKGGHNYVQAWLRVERNIDYINRVYPDATAKEKADVIWSI